MVKITKPKLDPKHPLESSFEGAEGAPYNEWVITMGEMPAEWWGDGYIIHTTAPAFIAKWGMCSESDAQAMGVGFGLGDGKSLGMMPAQPLGKTKVSNDELHDWRGKGLAAVVQFIAARELAADEE